MHLFSKMIMWLLHNKYKKLKPGQTILYIKGTGKEYPRYLVYTENERVRNSLDNL